MITRIANFLRPTVIALLAYGLMAGVLGVVHAVRNEPAPAAAGGDASLGLDGIDLTRVILPSPALAPEEVVRLQLAGLGDGRADGVGILQCFVLASPGNRLMTGPLDRFGQMVRQGPFQCMDRPQAVLVGRPQVVERTARVLITIVARNEQVHAFTFVLGQQVDAPFAGCWMTEAVLPSLPLPDVNPQSSA